VTYFASPGVPLDAHGRPYYSVCTTTAIRLNVFIESSVRDNMSNSLKSVKNIYSYKFKDHSVSSASNYWTTEAVLFRSL